MSLDRSVVVALAVVVAGTLATGPAIGLLHVPTADDVGTFGDGSLRATDVVLPVDGVVLDRGGYDARAYHLTVPAASATLTSVTGHPRVVYKLRIPALGWTSASTTFLGPEDTGRQSFSFQGATFAPERIDRESYDAELLLLVRSGQSQRVLASQNVTVEVES